MKTRYSLFSSFYSELDVLISDRRALGVVLFGISLRIVFWKTLYPVWKLFATFLVFRIKLVEYLGNFQSYKPSRSPFYDAFSAIFYVPTAPVLDIRAITVFALVVSCFSVIGFYIATRRLFDRQVALSATLLYSLYPKLLVLVGMGYPEAVSVGILIILMVALTDKDGELHGSILSGIAATVAYLLYIPAVVAGVWTGVVILVARIRLARVTGNVSASLREVALYGIVPTGVGLLYLVYGPVRQLLRTASGEWGNASSSLFINPSAYGFGEKLVRYLLYLYFDFWWHLPGFDKENGPLNTLRTLRAFFDWLFVPFLIGWTLLTLILSVLVFVGLIRFVRRRDLVDLYVLGWIGLYSFAFHYRNLGWIGAFQTRQILPLLPAICLAFGVGARDVRLMLQKYSVAGIDRRYSIDMTSVIHAIITIVLVLIVVLAFANVHLSSQNDHLSKEKPIKEVVELVGPDDAITVTSFKHYTWTVLYSEGRLWPSIWLPDREAYNIAANRTVNAEMRVVSASQVRSGTVRTDWLYVVSECGELTTYQRRLVDAALSTGGILQINRTLSRGSRCTITIKLIRFSS